MIPLGTIRELFEYNYWARDRQLQACALLAEEQFLRPMGSSYASLRDTLAHLLAAEWVWLERWCGRSPKAMPAGSQFSTLTTLKERWSMVERGVREYLVGLKEEALPLPLTYVNLKGETWTYPLWQTLFHLVNHQTYHRGQVTTLLRQLGAEPPQIDYLVAHNFRFAR